MAELMPSSEGAVNPRRCGEHVDLDTGPLAFDG